MKTYKGGELEPEDTALPPLERQLRRLDAVTAADMWRKAESLAQLWASSHLSRTLVVARQEVAREFRAEYFTEGGNGWVDARHKILTHARDVYDAIAENPFVSVNGITWWDFAPDATGRDFYHKIAAVDPPWRSACHGRWDRVRK